ncbi:MAG: hemolysin family protein [candidate division WOR-3 bacterium]
MFFKKDELGKIIDKFRQEASKDGEFFQVLKGLQNLYEHTVEEVMKPRVDVVMLSETDTLREMVEKFVEHRYSKYPVISEDGDKIIGVAHIKDLLLHLEDDIDKLTVRDIMREPFYIPHSMSCLRALKFLQQKRLSIGLVVDEYGNVIGIVTIEDLLEEIVGEIYEEHDKDEFRYEYLENGWIRMSAKLSLSEVEEILGIEFGETESSSIGGYVIEKLGRMPEKGEEFEIPPLKFIIEDVEPQRIITLLVRKADGNEIY